MGSLEGALTGKKFVFKLSALLLGEFEALRWAMEISWQNYRCRADDVLVGLYLSHMSELDDHHSESPLRHESVGEEVCFMYPLWLPCCFLQKCLLLRFKLQERMHYHLCPFVQLTLLIYGSKNERIFLFLSHFYVWMVVGSPGLICWQPNVNGKVRGWFH